MYLVSWNCSWRYPLPDWRSPLIPICWQLAFMNVLDFIKSIPASMMMSILFYLVTLIKCFNWILGVQTIRHSWDKHYLVFIMLFIYCWIHLLISCLSILMRHIGYLINRLSYKVLSGGFSLISFWKCLWKMDIISSLHAWLNSPT